MRVGGGRRSSRFLWPPPRGRGPPGGFRAMAPTRCRRTMPVSSGEDVMTEPYRLEIAGAGRNALGTAVMRDIIGQLERAGDRPVLLTGAGTTFSAGLDLKEVASLDAPGMERYLLLLDELIDAVFDYPGPTVACVNGHAIAGGCVLVLCCDVRIVVDD